MEGGGKTAARLPVYYSVDGASLEELHLCEHHFIQLSRLLTLTSDWVIFQIRCCCQKMEGI